MFRTDNSIFMEDENGIDTSYIDLLQFNYFYDVYGNYLVGSKWVTASVAQ